MHGTEVEFLRKRGIEFLKEAEIALERGSYDVACFLTEQSLQLFLKSTLLKLIGDYPRTHSIRHLLGEFVRVVKSEKTENFIRINRARLSMLEDAYLMARYFVKEYGREDAEDMVELVKEATRLINETVKW